MARQQRADRRRNDIALQVIDSDQTEEPQGDGKPSTYQGRHRGVDRLRQFASAGGVLAAITVLLAAGGTVLFWSSGIGDERPEVDADAIGDACELVVNQELLGPWAETEQGRDVQESSEENVRTFDCTYSAEHAGEDAYRLVTFYASTQVYESPSKARQAYAGVLEFEASEGNETAEVGGVGEQAAAATIEGDEETQVRLHAQEANSTVSLTAFFTGAPPEGGDMVGLTEDLASGLIDALPRVGK